MMEGEAAHTFRGSAITGRVMEQTLIYSPGLESKRKNTGTHPGHSDGMGYAFVDGIDIC